MSEKPGPSSTGTLAHEAGERPSVDVVVPFRGTLRERSELTDRLGALRLRPGDTLLIVDNTPSQEDRRSPTASEATEATRAEARPAGAVSVIHAAERPTPGYARNQGAALGDGAWLVFIDADVAPSPDLLDRYFDPPPGSQTALVGGGLLDEPVGPEAPAAARYAHLRGAMSQQDTFNFGVWGYPKTANVACRRAAFEAVGGFRDDIRAAEDADLAYRLRAAGWEVERREAASVVHFSRSTVRGLLRQKAIWGAGGAWLARTYPGSVPLARGPGLALWAVRETLRGLVRALREHDRDAAIFAVLHPLDALAWQFGRRLSNLR